MTHSKMKWAAAAILASGLCSGSSPARACGTVSDDPIQREDELVAIVWNPATKTEDFIREASFGQVSSKFAFLVPVPSLPKVSAVEQVGLHRAARLYDHLQVRIKMRLEQNVFIPPPASCVFDLAAQAKAAKSGDDQVKIVSQGMVAGYDTAVVKSDSPEALSDWLRKNGFGTTSTLSSWMTPYARGDWHIVAFKYDPANPKLKPRSSDGTVGLSDVKITFKADSPYYPYREPSDTLASPNRTWRAFVIAPKPMVPLHEDGSECTPKPAALAALKLSDSAVEDLGRYWEVPGFSPGSTWYLSPAKEMGPQPRVDKDLTWKEVAFKSDMPDLSPLSKEGEAKLADQSLRNNVLSGLVWALLIGWLLLYSYRTRRRANVRLGFGRQ